MLNDDEKTINHGGEIESFLPPAAARMLKEAAATPLDPLSVEPGLRRRKAVDRAHEQVRNRFPNLFRG